MRERDIRKEGGGLSSKETILSFHCSVPSKVLGCLGPFSLWRAFFSKGGDSKLQNPRKKKLK